MCLSKCRIGESHPIQVTDTSVGRRLKRHVRRWSAHGTHRRRRSGGRPVASDETSRTAEAATTKVRVRVSAVHRKQRGRRGGGN